MTTSYWLRQSFSSSETKTDVLIVGAGFVGLSTAFWLTEYRPDLKITIIDRLFCGAGASGRNAGFLTAGSAAFYKNLTQKWGAEKGLSIHRFAQQSLELLHQMVLEKSNISFEKCPSQTLLHHEDQEKSGDHLIFSPQDFGFVWKERSLLPQVLRKNYRGSFESSPEYKINPLQLMNHLKNLLISRGVRIDENLSAFNITEEGIKTELQTYRANICVLALNGYFPQFSNAFKDLIIPRRAQMMAVTLMEELDCSHLYYDPSERVYWRMSDEKTLVIGGKRLLDEAGETGDFEKISPIIQESLEAYLTERLGVKFSVKARWSGTMGFTEHELPLIDRIEAPIETYMIGGFSGHGMGFGFHAGKDVTELITGIKQQSFFYQFKKVKVCI